MFYKAQYIPYHYTGQCNDIFPLYFSTDSDDQSWFDYIWSGKFSSQQTNLEKDNAHILLAETLIYSLPQPPKSSVKVDHSYPAPESDIKVNISLIQACSDFYLVS